MKNDKGYKAFAITQLIKVFVCIMRHLLSFRPCGSSLLTNLMGRACSNEYSRRHVVSGVKAESLLRSQPATLRFSVY